MYFFNNIEIITNFIHFSGILLDKLHILKLFSKKIRNPTEENIKQFKDYNKIYSKLCRESKQTYYDSKFKEFSSDMRKSWDTIREVLGTKC